MRHFSRIRELPSDERPRERLLRHGSATLSDGELIAILLRTGHRGQSAIEIAHDLLESRQGLLGLMTAEFGALKRKGLGEAKAATLLAALELGTRVARAELPERQTLSRPAAAARYLALRYARREQEVMGALYLDTRHRLLRERELFIGTLNRTAVEPRPILKDALLLSAAGFILFHTHPSGDPAPSAEDTAFTRRLAAGAELLGVSLLDHLILGTSQRWVSLRERGLL